MSYRENVYPDCTGNPGLWPWVIWKKEQDAKAPCATPGCIRKPGKMLGTTSKEMAPFCQTCRMQLRRDAASGPKET
jgi:hypothetical protein